MIRLLLSITLYLVSVSAAHAYKSEELQEIDSNEYAKVSIFKASLEKDRTYRNIWVFFAYTAKGTEILASSKKYSEPIHLSTAQWRYNCGDHKLKVLDAYYINENGEEAKMGESLAVVANSAIERVGNHVCK